MTRQVFHLRGTISANSTDLSFVDGIQVVNSQLARHMIPANGRIGQALFLVLVAPGSSNSYSFQFSVNGSSTGQLATMGAVDKITTLTDWISVSAGDSVDIQVNKVGSPPNQLLFGYVVFIPDTADETLLMGSTTAALTTTQNVDEFIPMTGSQPAVVTTLNQSEIVVSTPGTLKNLYFEIANAPGASANRVFSVMVNGVKKFATTITGTATTGNSGATTFAVVAGDLITFVASTTSGGVAPASSAWARMGCVLAATNAGEFMLPMIPASQLPASNSNRQCPWLNGFSDWVSSPGGGRKRMRGDIDALNMYCRIVTAPGSSATRKFEFRAGAANKIIVTITDPATTGNTSTTVALVENQQVYDIQGSGTGTPAATYATCTLTCKFQARADPEFIRGFE